MTVHRLVHEQIIPRPLVEVAEFFADPTNLGRLTPAFLRFEILTPAPIEMHVGTIIQHALRVHGLPIHWTTLITEWKPPHEFVDVQISGPYVMWHHRHTFEALGDSTRVTDEVHYKLPLGALGRLAHTLFVRRDVENIFTYRQAAIERLFPINGGP